MKSPELKKIVESNFINTKYISITDRNYSHLDLEWIEKEAYKGYKNWLSIFSFSRGINNSDWKTNFDCEDLANSFKLYLRLLHAEANPHTLSSGKKNETDTESVLVGTICYNNSSSSAHAINIFINGNNKPVFFEPMYGKFINLSRQEKENIWYVSF